MTDRSRYRSTVPEALQEVNQWICWRETERNGKSTKVPINPATGQFASATDPATWATFETACDSVDDRADGIGFVFTAADPFVGVDLDDCRSGENDSPAAWATEIIDALDSYTEVSPSGTGYHVLVRGSLPTGRNRSGDLEMYETARFFTVTGNHVKGTPTEIRDRPDAVARVHATHLGGEDAAATSGNDHASARNATDSGNNEQSSKAEPRAGSGNDLTDDGVLERAMDAANGEKFRRLWKGDTAGYDSHSEADMALCALLAFWTAGDSAQIDRLFRQSGLYREKWDDTHYSDGSTYGEKTISRAVSTTTEWYQPSTDAVTDSSAESSGTTRAGVDQPATTLTESTDDDRPRADEHADAESLERAAPREQIQTLEQRVRTLEERNRRLERQLAVEREKRRQANGDPDSESEQTVWTRVRQLIGYR